MAKNRNDFTANMSIADAEYARCNKFASTCQLIECTIIALAYVLEFVKGARELPYIIVTILLAFSSPIAAKIILKKNPCSKAIKHIIGIGFGIFYIFICFTTTNILGFIYVLPMLVAILVYSEYAYVAAIGFTCWLVNIAQVIFYLKTGVLTWAEDSATIEIQILAMLLIAIYMTLCGQLVKFNSKIRVDKIEEQAHNTERTMEATMNISSSMVSNIETVTEKMDELNQASISTQESMGEVNAGATDTADAVQKQILLTDNIQNKVNEVENATSQIISSLNDANEAVDEGKANISALISQVEASIASGNDVAKQLEELQANMENINSVVEIIHGITSQTGLLALNASIEAARAGEAGRGFAVVASEISKMAGETDNATTTIRSMLDSFSSTITQVVRVTTDMIDKINSQRGSSSVAAQSFQKIENSTEVIIQESNNLAADVKNLAQANEEIIDSISTISAISEEVAAHASTTYSVSEQNARTVQDVAELISNLSELAERLKQA